MKNETMTVREAIDAIARRQIELRKECDRFSEIIYMNRKNLIYARKRIRLLERGVKLMEKGHLAKAEAIFEKENKEHFNGG